MTVGYCHAMVTVKAWWKSAIMKYVSTKKLRRGAATLMASAQQEPVTIRDDERDVAVLLSAEDYRKLTRREAVEELKSL
jgi:PHD/YefM family antitoxin component YafN of YafNO toxin-antitoxin module